MVWVCVSEWMCECEDSGTGTGLMYLSTQSTLHTPHILPIQFYIAQCETGNWTKQIFFTFFSQRQLLPFLFSHTENVQCTLYKYHRDIKHTTHIHNVHLLVFKYWTFIVEKNIVFFIFISRIDFLTFYSSTLNLESRINHLGFQMMKTRFLADYSLWILNTLWSASFCGY